MTREAIRAEVLREAAAVAYAMRPEGGRAWTAEQAACYAALTECGKGIEALSSSPPPAAPADHDEARDKRVRNYQAVKGVLFDKYGMLIHADIIDELTALLDDKDAALAEARAEVERLRVAHANLDEWKNSEAARLRADLEAARGLLGWWMRYLNEPEGDAPEDETAAYLADASRPVKP